MTPNLDEVRLLVDIEVVDTDTQRDAARALHALGPQWALVKGGHLRSSQMSPDLLYDGTDFYEFDAPRVDTRHDHGAGDTLAAATACALAHGYPCPTRWRSPSSGSPNASAPPTRSGTATARCPRFSDLSRLPDGS